MRDFEYSGVWWLPRDEDNEVAGILRFSERDGVRLELIGSFAGGPKDLSGRLESREPIILGVVDRHLVTLSNSLHMRRRISAPGLRRDDYRPEFALLGAHCQTPDEMRFSTIDVFYTYLEDWVPQVAGGQVRIIKDENGRYRYEASYDKPERLTSRTSRGVLTIEADVRPPLPAGRTIAFNEVVKLNVTDECACSVGRWLSDLVSPMQNLLTLATDQPNAVTALFVHPPHGEEDDSAFPIEVFYQPVYDAKISEKRNINEHQMLFSLRDRDQDYPAIVEKWLNASSELSHLMGLYFSVSYRSMYLQHRFDNIIRAAEAFHRARHSDSTARDSAKLRELVDSLLADVPDAVSKRDVDWARSRLLHNQPSLEQRLHELVADTTTVMAPLMSDADEFVERVAKTRHTFAHANAGTLDNRQLFDDVQVLDLLMKALFLQELGLPMELVTNLGSYSFAKPR